MLRRIQCCGARSGRSMSGAARGQAAARSCSRVVCRASLRPLPQGAFAGSKGIKTGGYFTLCFAAPTSGRVESGCRGTDWLWWPVTPAYPLHQPPVNEYTSLGAAASSPDGSQDKQSCNQHEPCRGLGSRCTPRQTVPSASHGSCHCRLSPAAFPLSCCDPSEHHWKPPPASAVLLARGSFRLESGRFL